MRKIFIGFFSLLCLLSATSAQNIILNSSFEFWLDSLGIRIPFGWYTSEPQDSGTAIRVTDPHTGTFALQLNGSDTSAYAATLSICFPGHDYYFSGWGKSNNIIAGSFIITWLNLSQQIVGNPVILPIYRSTIWRQYTQIVQAPDSAVLVNINIVTLPFISMTVDDITLTDTILTGVEEQKTNTLMKSIKIWPNPCYESVKILPGVYPTDILIYNINGNIVKKLKLESDFNLNVKDLKSGVYFVRFGTEDKTKYKLIIQQ